MDSTGKPLAGVSCSGISTSDEAVSHLRECITSGKHWYIALLESIGLWTAPGEIYQERHYQYVIASEAFDWLLLAERLCSTVDSLLPPQEKERLLLHAEPPLELDDGEFRRVVGNAKYRAILNYWYGVVVEGALLASIEETIHKERLTAGLSKKRDVSEEAYERIYGAPKKTLLKAFHQEADYPDDGTLSVDGLKEFAYWLFKYRLKQNDGARVASDTKRGIEQLQSMASKHTGASVPPHPDPEKIIDLNPRSL